MQYLTARITRYLRLVICLSPSSPLLGTLAQYVLELYSGRPELCPSPNQDVLNMSLL